MRQFLAGVFASMIVCAIAVGLSPAARADVGSYFESVADLYKADSNFQRGYIAGVYDAVQTLAPIAGQGSALYSIADCLDRQGDTISQFEIYASRALQNAPSQRNAADPIMAACVRK